MDEYDRAADAYREDPESDLAKTWRLSQVSPTPAAPGFRVRFTTVAAWLQIPSIKPDAEAEKEKGARLTNAELRELHQRIELARAWLERWAPEEARFQVQETTPKVELTPEQRRYLFAIKALIGTVHDAGEMQNQLYEVAKKERLLDAKGKPSQDAFAAIYLAFLGKPNGPRAGWLLLSIEPERVRRRLDDLGRAA
jgi:lysyl-tRNA synthetase class 1